MSADAASADVPQINGLPSAMNDVSSTPSLQQSIIHQSSASIVSSSPPAVHSSPRQSPRSSVSSHPLSSSSASSATYVRPRAQSLMSDRPVHFPHHSIDASNNDARTDSFNDNHTNSCASSPYVSSMNAPYNSAASTPQQHWSNSTASSMSFSSSPSTTTSSSLSSSPARPNSSAASRNHRRAPSSSSSLASSSISNISHADSSQSLLDELDDDVAKRWLDAATMRRNESQLSDNGESVLEVCELDDAGASIESSPIFGAASRVDDNMKPSTTPSSLSSSLIVTDPSLNPGPVSLSNVSSAFPSSASRVNLLLSSNLTRRSVIVAERRVDPDSSSDDSRKGRFRRLLSRIRRLLSPSTRLTHRALLLYAGASIVTLYLVRDGRARALHARSMVSFLLPFLFRELPHIVGFFIVLAMVRTSLHQRLHGVGWSPLVVIGWAANTLSLFGVADTFRRMISTSVQPFREAMRDAGIHMPAANAQDDVLTIATMDAQRDIRQDEPIPAAANGTSDERLDATATKDSVESSQFTNAFDVALTSSSVPSSSSSAPSSTSSDAETFMDTSLSTSVIPLTSLVASASSSSSPSASSQSASAAAAASRIYSRIGRMSPLRWFLSSTQITRTLLYAEQVQWKTGVVYESIYTRQKEHKLKLDIYRPKAAAEVIGPNGQKLPPVLLPVFLYIHGGGFITGHRSFHSLAMLYAIAKSGYIVISINYRLSPWVKHPTHLMDCKKALGWVRTHAASLHADADCVVVGGESAGALLAQLMALTANVLHLQPGFEHIDTSVTGVVDLYGIHDFTDEHYHYRCREDAASRIGGMQAFLHHVVMGGPPLSQNRAAYEMASPTYRLGICATQNIPPVFMCHGEYDDLVPVEDSQAFWDRLKERREDAQVKYEASCESHARECRRAKHDTSDSFLLPNLPPLPLAPFPLSDVFIRVPFASHGFNNVLTIRSFALNDSVTLWLGECRRIWLKRKAEREAREEREQEEEEIRIARARLVDVAFVDAAAPIVDQPTASFSTPVRPSRRTHSAPLPPSSPLLTPSIQLLYESEMRLRRAASLGSGPGDFGAVDHAQDEVRQIAAAEDGEARMHAYAIEHNMLNANNDADEYQQHYQRHHAQHRPHRNRNRAKSKSMMTDREIELMEMNNKDKNNNRGESNNGDVPLFILPKL